MNYRIEIITSFKDSQVKVLKETAGNTYSLEWAFTLKGDNEPVFLLEKLNKDCFIVANRSAWVRIYNISNKELIFEKNYNENRLSPTLISEDKTKLYVAYATEDYKAFIETTSLIDFSIVKTIELPKHFTVKHFTLGIDNQLMFYDTKEKPSYGHGYNIVNEETGEIEHFPMEHPQLVWFIMVTPPVISPQSNLGIMPYWDKIEIKKDKNNNPLFVFKVMLFNLTNFKVEKIISVREFTTQQLRDENPLITREEYAEIFQAEDKESKKYRYAVKDFLRDLESIFFDETSDSFWLCFRGGIVRKMTFDGKLSPLFVTASISPSTEEENFDSRDFDSYIAAMNKSTLILTADYSEDED